MRFSLRSATILSPLLALPLVFAESVQYCRSGYSEGQVDFCMGIATYRNASAQASDVYLSMTVSRSSAHGWTAVGTGAEMAGSTMFIVYGDPSSGADPVLSIRTIDGHHQPRPLDLGTLPNVRILHAKWRQTPQRRHGDDHDYPIAPHGPATHIADIAVVCHGCAESVWHISPTTGSQSFIWAWNDRQKFSSYPLDVHLDMHRHHAGSGGYGTFYVDMAKSLAGDAVPSPPTIQPGVARLGTSDSPIGVLGLISSLRDRPLVKGHGFLMGLAFLVLFPLGVVLMRTPSGNPFKRHWRVQAAATVLAWMGTAAAAVMTGGKMPKTVHQWVGAAIALILGIQSVLGWRHHMVFLRLRRRTWISHGHIWLGRAAVAAGWVNVVTGLKISGHEGLGIGLVAALVVVEALGVGLWVWVAQQRAKKAQSGETEAHALMARGEGTEDYFAIESDDEFESDLEDGERKEVLPKQSTEVVDVKSQKKQ